MTAQPLVSVVVPAYNAERFLRACLESVAAQTYLNYEVIVVDDGSTDSTPEIVAAFPAFRYVCRENGGVSAARNTGVAASTGELLAFIDSDDLWLPERLATQVAFLQAHPEVDLVFCHQLLALEEGAEVPRGYTHPSQGADPSYVPSAWLVRAESYQRVGAWGERYRFGQDTDWLARAKDAGLTTFLMPDVLVYKRAHATNLSNQTANLHRDMMGLLRSSIARKRAGASGNDPSGEARG
jgi:glycosyltransferase involved in cell wall biosynthesis